MPTASRARNDSSIASKQPATAAISNPDPDPGPTGTSLPPSLLSLRLGSCIPSLFSQSQSSLITHRKNHAALFKLHVTCSKYTTETDKGIKLIGEKHFNDVFLACTNRVLGIKKGNRDGGNEADRVLKFIAGYVVYCQQQFNLLRKSKSKPNANPNANDSSSSLSDSDDDDDDDDSGLGLGSTSNRFISILLKHLLKGFSSKNKIVRWRCAMGVAGCVNGLESLDDDLYQLLMISLIQRSRDKESIVRVQSIIALAKLQGGEVYQDEEEHSTSSEESGNEEMDEERLLKKSQRILIQTLRFDPSSETRRASLFNLTPNDSNLPLILERLSDSDPINRRCVYLGSLTQIQTQASNLFKKRMIEKEGKGKVSEGPDGIENQQEGENAYSNQSGLNWDHRRDWGLSPAQSEEILRKGLGERDDSVRKACIKLLNSWFDATGGDVEMFLARFDTLHSPTSSSTLLNALTCLLSSRPQLIDSISSLINSPEKDFWSTLSSSSILLIRSLTEFGKKNSNGKHEDNNDLVDDILPPVTALALKMKDEWGGISNAIQMIEDLKFDHKDNRENDDDEDDDEDQEKMSKSEALEKTLKEKTLLLRELLNLAMKLDYGDEIGRRKMFGLVRDMLDSSISPTENSSSSSATLSTNRREARNEADDDDDDVFPSSEASSGLAGGVKINVTPSSLIPFCLDVLLRLSAGQRDFMRVVVELVQGDEETDSDDEQEEDESQTRDEEDEDEIEAELSGVISPKKKSKSGGKAMGINNFEKNLVTMSRKLDIVRGMLERVGGVSMSREMDFGVIARPRGWLESFFCLRGFCLMKQLRSDESFFFRLILHSPIAQALQENTFLHGLIPDLIAPAVRSKDASLRESGIICLGLCCLLDNSLALDSMPLILDQISRASGPIKLRSTEILFDLIGIHGIAYLCGAPSHPGNVKISKEELEELLRRIKEAKVKQSRLLRGLLGLMEDDDEALQATAAQGIAKLMLTGALSSPYIETKKKFQKVSKKSIIGDRDIDADADADDTINPNSTEEEQDDDDQAADDVQEDQSEDDEDAALYSLVLVYMSPETIGNQQLRQCLSYFLPAYCGSAKDHARRLQRVFLKILHILSEVYYEKDANQEMVTPLQVGLQLIEWTDPGKALNQTSADWSLHLDLAIDLVKSLFTREEKEERKVFCQLLSKLSLPEPEEIEDRKAETLIYLISRLSDVNPLSDSVSRNALGRFETSLCKRYPESFAAFKELDLSAEPSPEDPEEIRSLRSFLVKACRLDLTGQTTSSPKVIEKTRPKSKPVSKSSSSSKKGGSSKSGASAAKGTQRKIGAGRRKQNDSESEEESEDEEDDEDIDADDAASQAGTETGTNTGIEDDEDELSETEEDFDD